MRTTHGFICLNACLEGSHGCTRKLKCRIAIPLVRTRTSNEASNTAFIPVSDAGRCRLKACRGGGRGERSEQQMRKVLGWRLGVQKNVKTPGMQWGFSLEISTGLSRQTLLRIPECFLCARYVLSPLPSGPRRAL